MNFAARHKHLEREERKVLRNQREDIAGKLIQKVPELTSLSLAINEMRPDGRGSENQYIRRVVVESTAALFEVPCSSAYCKDGGYDVTREVLSALTAREERFEGEQACRGSSSTGDCGRVLHYVATATYRSKPVDP